MEFGRVRIANFERPVYPDLSDPEVVKEIIADATRVARQEQAQRAEAQRVARKVARRHASLLARLARL